MSTMGLAATINALKAKGYVEDFNLKKNFPEGDSALQSFTEEFVIDQIFRFVMTDSGDQSILYAIHSTKTGQKGILVNGFGIYSESITNMKIQSLERWENEGGKNILSDRDGVDVMK